MPKRTSYEAGTPCWVDLGTPDVDAGAGFYGGLLGWELPETEQSEQFGGYRQATRDGSPVAGIMPLMQEGQPTAWTTYIAVEDADGIAGLMGEAGGTVIAEPMDVGELGRMAVFSDTTGAVFGVWQARSFPGAAIVNEPGAFCWNELGTRDPEQARDFYTQVFGWNTRESEMPGGAGIYTEWLLGGEQSVGGMVDLTGRVPDEVPANWLTYFAVEDADMALAKVEQGGGAVAFGPIDIPIGRFGVVQDPHGASFALIALKD